MATPEIKPIKQFAKAGDNYAGRGSSDGTYIYVPSVTNGIATLSKYDLKGTLIWEKVLSQGGSGATSVIAPDGSILVASSSGGASGKSSALAKFNALGEKLWEITNAYPEFGAIAIRENTIYVGGGTTTGFNSAKTAFINAYTLDTGKLVWNKTYPNTGASGIGEIRIDGDQIYVSAGPYGKQDFDYAMAGRLDLDGNIIWWKNGPSSDWNNLGSIKIIGNSVIGTGYKADGGDRMDARIMSFNISDGTIQWDKSWGDSNAQGGNSIESLNGKLYVSYSDGVGWNTGSNNTGFTVVDELDTSGNLLKSYKFDVPSSYDGAGSLVKVGESLYLLGQTNGTITGQSSGGGYDIFLASLIEADTKKPIIRGNSLYTIVDGPSWTQAEANSVKLGGHLVTIENDSENTSLIDNFDSVDNGGGLWIGLSDATVEGQWAWSSGSISSFRKWNIGQPDNSTYYSASGQDFAFLAAKGSTSFPKGSWDDSTIQERSINGIAETPFIRRGDSAYVIVSGPTWEEAEANAVKLGGHLVTVNDVEEDKFLSSTFALGSWIGITDKDSEGTFKWISGEQSSYRNWHPGEPNNAGGNQDYGWYHPGYSNRWDDTGNIAEVTKGIAEIKLTPNNTPTGTPTVTGTFEVGSTLTIDATTIKDSDNFTGYTPTFKYSWETSTDGATWSNLTTTDGVDNNNTYILTAVEASKKIRGVISYLDGYGTNEVVNSVASDLIANVTPTYTLTPSATTINEGAVLTNTVATTNVASGTKLYYALSGTGITTADFSAGTITGEGITDATGKFTFTHTLANDLTTEGAETLNIKLFTDSARTVQVGTTASVSIADTSLTQVVKDTTPPAIALTTSKASLTAGEQAIITFTLSEDTTDFTASDITTSSAGTLSDFKGLGKIYTASFTPKANTQAAAVVSVASKTFSDAAGNFNNDEVEANNKITFFVDTVVAPGVKITLPVDLTTDENGKSVVIPLVLKTEPKAAVRLDFLLSKGAEATLSAKSFEFSTTNWSTPQTLTLKGIEDYVDDIDQKYSLTITGSSTDKSYETSTDPKGLQIPVINMINLDDGEDEGKSIYGDAGAQPIKDTIKGTEGPDRVYGLLEDDILYGGAGRDELFGGYGKDILYGEIGDDELYGENENDTLYGGDGNDRLTGGEGFDKLIGGAGNDTYVIDDERDTIDDQGLGTDIDTVLFRANLTTYTMPASIKNAVLDSGSAFKLIGNGLDNNLKGNDNNNEIDGGDGNDVLNGGGGDDLLKGGSGSDTAHYHKQLPGFTFGAEGGAGITANLLTGKASGTEIGNDTLVAIENIETSDGSDTLIGNENANTLIANGGNDLLEANGGNDILIGGQGDDQLDGGAGDDQAVYSGVRDDYEVSQDSSGTKVIIKDKRQFQDGIDTITGIETVKFADKSLVLADLTSKTLDFNGDGNVDSFDSILMMRHMMGTYPGESIKKDIPGKFDLTAIQRKLTNAFADTFSLNGGLRLDIDGDKRISAFRDGMMITQHILKQGTSDSPWAPPGFNPPDGFPAQMQQHLKDLIGF